MDTAVVAYVVRLALVEMGLIRTTVVIICSVIVCNTQAIMGGGLPCVVCVRLMTWRSEIRQMLESTTTYLGVFGDETGAIIG